MNEGQEKRKEGPMGAEGWEEGKKGRREEGKKGRREKRKNEGIREGG